MNDLHESRSWVRWARACLDAAASPRATLFTAWCRGSNTPLRSSTKELVREPFAAHHKRARRCAAPKGCLARSCVTRRIALRRSRSSKARAAELWVAALSSSNILDALVPAPGRKNCSLLSATLDARLTFMAGRCFRAATCHPPIIYFFTLLGLIFFGAPLRFFATLLLRSANVSRVQPFFRRHSQRLAALFFLIKVCRHTVAW